MLKTLWVGLIKMKKTYPNKTGITFHTENTRTSAINMLMVDY